MIRRNRIDKDALHDAFEHILSKANKNGSIVSFSVACAIVRAMLGEDWFDRYVLPEGKKSFFTVDESSALQLDMSLYRISQKVAKVQIGREMVVAEKSGPWMRVYANTDIEEQHSDRDTPMIGADEATPPISGRWRPRASWKKPHPTEIRF